MTLCGTVYINAILQVTAYVPTYIEIRHSSLYPFITALCYSHSFGIKTSVAVKKLIKLEQNEKQAERIK